MTRKEELLAEFEHLRKRQARDPNRANISALTSLQEQIKQESLIEESLDILSTLTAEQAEFAIAAVEHALSGKLVESVYDVIDWDKVINEVVRSHSAWSGVGTDPTYRGRRYTVPGEKHDPNIEIGHYKKSVQPGFVERQGRYKPTGNPNGKPIRLHAFSPDDAWDAIKGGAKKMYDRFKAYGDRNERAAGNRTTLEKISARLHAFHTAFNNHFSAGSQEDSHVAPSKAEVDSVVDAGLRTRAANQTQPVYDRSQDHEALQASRDVHLANLERVRRETEAPARDAARAEFNANLAAHNAAANVVRTVRTKRMNAKRSNVQPPLGAHFDADTDRQEHEAKQAANKIRDKAIAKHEAGIARAESDRAISHGKRLDRILKRHDQRKAKQAAGTQAAPEAPTAEPAEKPEARVATSFHPYHDDLDAREAAMHMKDDALAAHHAQQNAGEVSARDFVSAATTPDHKVQSAPLRKSLASTVMSALFPRPQEKREPYISGHDVPVMQGTHAGIVDIPPSARPPSNGAPPPAPVAAATVKRAVAAKRPGVQISTQEFRPYHPDMGTSEFSDIAGRQEVPRSTGLPHGLANKTVGHWLEFHDKLWKKVVKEKKGTDADHKSLRYVQHLLDSKGYSVHPETGGVFSRKDNKVFPAGVQWDRPRPDRYRELGITPK